MYGYIVSNHYSNQTHMLILYQVRGFFKTDCLLQLQRLIYFHIQTVTLTLTYPTCFSKNMFYITIFYRGSA